MTTEHTPNDSADDTVLHDVNKDITETYDKQVYTSNAFPFSSPGHLRAAAHLWGLESVPLENARVLELGCAGGGNLLPFAVAYPNAHVVGVDLSSVQVNQGKEVIEALGLKNLHLHAMSLTDITPDFGQFDYIIAHGVFSWVPPEVREAMLRILRDNLSPLGIGYISYNTYPGWKAGDIVRDAMLLHSHGAQTEDEKLASAKAVLNLLSDGIAQSNPLAPSLRAAVAQLRKHSDYYIAHEYLEIFNNPCYLLEFVNLADQYNLTHIGDAEPHVEMSVTYGQNVQLNHSLVALGQPREMRQQYLDFAVGRNFRKSLLVHKDRANQIAVSPNLDRLADLRWAGHFTPIASKDKAPRNRLSFKNHRNLSVHSSNPIVVAILNILTNIWPSSINFNDLVNSIRLFPSKTHSSDDLDKEVLVALQTLFHLNSLRYTLEKTAYDRDHTGKTINTIKTIYGFTYLIEQQQNQNFSIGLYNLWHEGVNIKLKKAEHYITQKIDSTEDRKQLTNKLRDALKQGFVPAGDGTFLTGQRNLDSKAAKMLGDLLDLLKRQGLII